MMPGLGIQLGLCQHLIATRFRALELGLPLVRVANTGISGVYDSNGKNLEVISLNKKSVIDTKLFYSTQINSNIFPRSFFNIIFHSNIWSVSNIF